MTKEFECLRNPGRADPTSQPVDGMFSHPEVVITTGIVRSDELAAGFDKLLNEVRKNLIMGKIVPWAGRVVKSVCESTGNLRRINR